MYISSTSIGFFATGRFGVLHGIELAGKDAEKCIIHVAKKRPVDTGTLLT